MLAEGFERMRQDRSGEGVLDDMIGLLLRESEVPPRKVEGVGQEFLDGMIGYLFFLSCSTRGGVRMVVHFIPHTSDTDSDYEAELERVPRKALKKGMDCPICSNPFLEGIASQRPLPSRAHTLL